MFLSTLTATTKTQLQKPQHENLKCIKPNTKEYNENSQKKRRKKTRVFLLYTAATHLNISRKTNNQPHTHNIRKHRTNELSWCTIINNDC